MKLSISTIFLAAAVFVPVPSFAQGESGEAPESTSYKFEGDDVTGTLEGPTGSDIRSRDPRKMKSLLEVRRDFVPELLETIDEL